MSLGKQLFRSGIWVQASKLMQFGSNALVTIILANLLPPRAFGLFGIVTLYTSLIVQFTSFGITAGIVQKKDVTQLQLSSAFWINLGFFFFAALLVLLTGGLAADFYKESELRHLVPLLSMSIILTPFYIVHRMLIERELDFQRIAKCEIAAVIGSGIVGVVLAWMGFGVYSLAWQPIAMSSIYLITYNFSVRWRPDFVFSYSEVKELFHFSVKMKIGKMTGYVGQNVDFLILSKAFDPTLYGLYTVAYRVLFFPVRRIGRVIGEMLFPTFSRIQDDLPRIKAGVLRSINLLSLALFPLTVIIASFSRPLVNIFLNSEWSPLIDVLYLYTIVGAIMTFERVFIFIFPAVGRPGVVIWLEGAKMILTGIAVLAGSPYGLAGVGVGLLIARSLVLAVNFQMASKLLQITISDILSNIAGPAVAALGMGMACFYIESTVKGSMDLVPLTASIGIASLSYLAVLWITSRKDLKYYYRLTFDR